MDEMVDDKKQIGQNEKKWTKTLMQAGWTAIPTVFLERQKALALDSTDLNILLHLIKHWWYSENLPKPGKKSIAECMNKDTSTIRRRIQRMENDGLIKRLKRFDKEKGQQANQYSFQGLIDAATPFAKEIIKEREGRKEESNKRRNRKKPISEKAKATA